MTKRQSKQKKSHTDSPTFRCALSRTHTHSSADDYVCVCVCVCVCVSMIVRAANNARPYPRIFTVRTAPQSKFRHLLRHETRKNRPNGNSPREPPFNLILIIPVNLFSFAPHQQQQQHQQQRQRRCLIAHTRTPLPLLLLLLPTTTFRNNPAMISSCHIQFQTQHQHSYREK